jgi:hypothetical protein
LVPPAFGSLAAAAGVASASDDGAAVVAGESFMAGSGRGAARRGDGEGNDVAMLSGGCRAGTLRRNYRACMNPSGAASRCQYIPRIFYTYRIKPRQLRILNQLSGCNFAPAGVGRTSNCPIATRDYVADAPAFRAPAGTGANIVKNK